jgi:hypothetical protein
MKIRMNVEISGTHNGRPWPTRGAVAEVPDAQGAKLCAAGMAAPVAEATRTETATPPPAETSEQPEPETTQTPEEETRPAEPVKRGRGRPRKPTSGG